MIQYLPYPQNNLLSVEVVGGEYDYALKASSNMSSSHKRGEWGRGYMNTNEDPHRVERNGRLGEVAFGKLMGMDIQPEYLYDGDKYDFKIGEKTINVKTSFEHKDPYRMIKEDDNKREYPLFCDYYVFLYSDYDHLLKKQALVIFDGYISREDIQSKAKVRESIGNL